MKLELTINKKLFEICKKYKIESALIFDKIAYLKLINSSYDVFVDMCLLHLLEMLIADGFVTIYNDTYIITNLGIQFIEEIDSLTTKKSNVITKEKAEELIKDTFIEDYLNKFKSQDGKFIKTSGRTLGVSSKQIKNSFIKFYITYGENIFNLLKEKKIDSSIEDIILKCTEEYVESQTDNKYLYCQRADYFILKQQTDKTYTSNLLFFVEEYINSYKEDNQLNFDFYKKLTL